MGGYARGVRVVIMEAFEWITRKVGDRWAWELERGRQGGLIKGIGQVELW